MNWALLAASRKDVTYLGTQVRKRNRKSLAKTRLSSSPLPFAGRFGTEVSCAGSVQRIDEFLDQEPMGFQADVRELAM